MTFALLFQSLNNDDGERELVRAASRLSIVQASARAENDALVEGIRRGDSRAFETVFRRYHARLVSFAASYVRSADGGEEVVADVFAWLWEHRSAWVPSAGVAAYLFGAVRNRALNVVKRTARDGRRDATLRAAGKTPGTAEAPADLAQRTEMDDYMAAAWRIISTFAERRRLILTLRWQYELGWDEIASVTGMTAAAVQMDHSRALAILRTRLQELA
jgi:RNA polymerase sigma-70 factor (ECF subfamily)